MKDFFHILNPNKKNRKGVEKYFLEHPSLQSMWVEKISHPTHLETIVLWAVNEGRTKLAIWGGDGSFNRVVQCLYELKALEKVSVVLIPAGTCNDFARKLGFPKWNKLVTTNPTLDELFDVGLLTTEEGKRVFMNNAGFGRTPEHIHGRSNPIKDIFSFRPNTLNMSWSLGGKEHFETRPILLGIVFNAPFFSGGLHFDPDILPDDGVLNGFFESPQSRIGLFLKFLKGRLGKSLADEHTIRLDGERIEVESESDLYPQVDGEPFGSRGIRSMNYSILPNKLRFLNWR